MNIQGQNQNLDFGFNNGGNNNWNNMDPFSNGNMIGEKIEENPDSFDPASYFALQNHKETDFDMNIIQSDVGFMPHGKSFDGLEEQLALPDTMGLEGLLSNPFTGYKFNNN